MLLYRMLHSAKTDTPVPKDLEISGFTSHVEKVRPGCAFVCIKGTKADGHTKAKEAVLRGASVIIAEHMTDADAYHVLTDDTRTALALMYSNYYENPADEMTLAGVTGTNGKTTTTYLIHHILTSCGKNAGLIGTVENLVGDERMPSHYTTPGPEELFYILRRMADRNVNYAVMEVSSHSLAQRRVAGLYFKAAVFTNLTRDHLDYHGTMERYCEEKRRLFFQCEYGVLNADDPYSERMADSPCKRITYGIDSSADFRAADLSLESSGTLFKLYYPQGVCDVFLKIPGRFSVYNALAAITACYALGIQPAAAAGALANAEGVPGRMEVIPTGRDFQIILDYAHTPDGLMNMLKAVRGFAKGRVVTLFGCGGDRDRGKRPVMGRIAGSLSDFVIVTSDNPRTEDPTRIIDDILVGLEGQKTPYVVIENRKKAIEYAVLTAQKGDIIVLAGKGHESYQIIGDTSFPFDERSIVAGALAMKRGD